MASLQRKISARFSHALRCAVGEEHADTDPLVRPTQNPKFGDYQANLAMSLGKKLGEKPRDIATRILEHFDPEGLCEPPTIAGPGFINLALTDACLSEVAGTLWADPRLGVEWVSSPSRVVVDYSAPNVAKEMHVGHLRSTVIGDALCRVLEFEGHDVVRQNHLGDWGTQFGMLIEYMLDASVSTGSISDLNTFYQEAKKRFDGDADFAERARKRVVSLQGGEERTNELWRTLVEQSKHHFREAYDRLGVGLTDDDIRGESFYNPELESVVEALREAGLAVESEGATCVFVPGFESKDGHPVPMIVRKSDGGFGYAATDLAAIRFRVRELHAERLAYVVDARQRDHFEQVFWTARQAGWLDDAHVAQHVPFGTVLGEDGKPFKTREGGTVRLAELLHEAVERARDVVAEKNPEMEPAERLAVAEMVGIGAIKYADLSSDRVKDYVFSWDRMLAMDGNTAPYLQYARARVAAIFRKADVDPASLGGDVAAVRAPEERALVLELVRLVEVVGKVSTQLEPHHLCTWAYDLATAYSRFYESCPVLRASDEGERRSRLLLCDLTARGLALALGLLGIETPERM